MMYIITDDEINKLSESSKNDFYRILAELNHYTNQQSNCCQIRRCGNTWMLCDGICTKCYRYLQWTSTTAISNY